ncbi:MAG TPA: hypothetical protein VFA07_02295 [Chthonomonadaceae bacterium]|nr:hypothetical protein [Chthonomonadaceae bacterium]
MRSKMISAGLLAATMIAPCVVMPATAGAQSWLNNQIHHRQQTKNTWRNVAIGAGALGVYGLLRHDPTLAIVGGAGALYSLSRYEHDRHSQSQMQRARAAYFSRPYFYRNGVRYHRRTVHRNGQTYYQFVRG